MHSALLFFIVISVLVTVHEFGHYIVARICGVGVKSFALGFPPTLWQKKVGKTVYKINAIPLGGYVSLVGEADDTEAVKWSKTESLENKYWYQKLMILSAGIVMNFILAIVLLTALALYYKGFSGISAGYTMYIDIVNETIHGLYQFISQIFTRGGLDSVSGPVGIANILGQASQSGIDKIIFLTSVLSINLGLLNLIPFPALDGGQMLVVIIETIIRRKLPNIVVNGLNMIGFAALMVLSIVVSWKDIAKLIG
jgi:regulator of sigma E protease